MLIDRHCRLDQMGQAKDQAGVLAAPSRVFRGLEAPREG